MKKILIIAAHPDDEVLGCGGSIARFKREGKEIGLLMLTDGEGSRLNSQKSIRQNALSRSVEVLGIDKVWSFDFPDNQLDTVSRLTIVKKLEVILQEYCPDTVFTHSPVDLNQDHRIAAEVTAIATRSVPGTSVKNVLFYEVPSSTEWGITTNFNALMYVELTEHDLNKKFDALNAYEAELRHAPHPRSPEYLRSKLMVRGSECGVAYAEAFEPRIMLV